MEPPKGAEIANIGRSVVIKGELSGSEDLYVDGQVEGTIELHGNSLTVGPNGQVRANVNAKNVFIQGKVDGNLRSSDRTELRKSAVVTGDIISQKIAIEDGAYFKGKVDIQKELVKTPTPVAKGSTNLPIDEVKTSFQAPVKPGGIGQGVNEQMRPPSTAIPAAAVASTAATNTEQTAKTPVTDQKKF